MKMTELLYLKVLPFTLIFQSLKTDDKIYVCKISKKCFTPFQAISYREFKDQRANTVDLDEVAHHEPPHQDLGCLQIQLFFSLILGIFVDYLVVTTCHFCRLLDSL